MDIKHALKTIQENIVSGNSVTRYAICRTCEKFNSKTKICMQCGCFMPAKTKLKSVVCPLSKW
jgi:hypothetical protein